MHKIQGIGAGFIPSTYNTQVVDKIIRVKDDDAIRTRKQLSSKKDSWSVFLRELQHLQPCNFLKCQNIKIKTSSCCCPIPENDIYQPYFMPLRNIRFKTELQ